MKKPVETNQKEKTNKKNKIYNVKFICKSIGYIFIASFLNLNYTFSQNVCSEVLKKANKLYDDGQLLKVEPILFDCIRDGFSKPEKVQAYRLITLCHLFNDADSAAKENMLRILLTDPEFKPNPALDPSEFITLYNKFRTPPIYSLGIVAGANVNLPYLINPYGINNTTKDKGSFEQAFGFQVGLGIDLLIKSKLHFNSGLFFINKGISFSQNINQFGVLKSEENQTSLEIPLQLRFYLFNTKLTPFIQAGISGNLLLVSNSILTRSNNTLDALIQGAAIDMLPQRNILTYNFLFGGGLKYKLKYSFIILDCRYALGMMNYSNTTKKYESNELTYRYGYVDPSFSIDNLSISVGYFLSFYKPKLVRLKND